MKVIIDDPNEKISLEDIEKFKKKLKIKLPQGYIDFLLKYNGGGVSGGYLFITKKRKLQKYNGIRIYYFYSLKEIFDIIKMKDDCVINGIDVIKEYVLDAKQILIAECDTLFVTMNTINGKISFLEHECFEEDGLVPIGMNFEEFINSFKIDE